MVVLAVASARSSQASALLVTLLATICVVCGLAMFLMARLSKSIIARASRVSELEREVQRGKQEREALVASTAARDAAASKIKLALGASKFECNGV